MANNSSPKKHSHNITGMSTVKKIFLAHRVIKHSEPKSILLITSPANTQKRNFCNVMSNQMTLNAAIMCPFKQLQIKKQNNIDCIYMTSLCCEFILSLFWFVEPLKKIIGCGWVFLLIGLALLRTTLCACSRSFWVGAENRSSIGLLIWPAHLFRHFLRRVLWLNKPYLCH